MGRRLGPLLIVLGALALWLSSRLTWVTVTTSDDKSGTDTLALNGGFWSLELTAVTLLLVAGALAGFALRRGARRVVGVVCAIAAAAAAWRPVQLLTYGADPLRAQNLLQSGDANDITVESVSISDWAVVSEATVNAIGPVCGLAAAAIALVGGVMLATRPGEDTAKANKYETAAARKDVLAQDLEESPDSGRVMWDALDADIDPTDLDGPERR